MQTASDRKTTVFISYRRQGGFVLAKYIFDHLHAAGYDVFMDVQSLGAGEFEQTTLAEVAARDYFLLVLTSGSLKGIVHENDWLRKELMQAVKSGRTVVPVLAEKFKFEDRRVQEVLKKLPPALQALPLFNAVRIPQPEYFDSAMERLRSFLKAIADSAPSHGTNKSSGTAAAPKSVAEAQSALHGLTLPPVTSLTKTHSATPWSDLQATFAGTGVIGADALTPKKSSPGSLKGPVAPPRPPAPTLKEIFGGLSWTKVSKADKYLLEESGDADFKDPGKVVYQGPMTSWLDLSDLSREPLLPPSLTRFTQTSPVKYYRVKAIGKGAAGESDLSNIVTVESDRSNIATLATAKSVAKPRPRTPTLKETFGGLSWTEVRDADKYVLEESGDADFKDPGKVVYQGPMTWMNLAREPSSPPSLTRFTQTSPVKYYRVKAIGKGAAGESDLSNIVTVESDRSNIAAFAGAKLVTPLRPRTPTLKETFGGLSWTKVRDADKYVLEESGDADFKQPGKVVYQGPMTWMNLAREPSSPPSLTRFTQTSPVKYYRVKAIGKGAAGESDLSNIVTVESDRSNIAAFAGAKLVTPLRPRTPTLKETFGGLSWTEVRDADKYVLEESGDADFKQPGKVVYQGPMTWMNLAREPSSPPSLTRFTQTSPVKYYRVKAIGKGAAGESDWSNIVGDRLDLSGHI